MSDGLSREAVMQRTALLSWSLFSGAIYFFLVGIVHLLGTKIPPLFIYFNVPSLAYQDRIIAVLALGWGVFFLAGFSEVRQGRRGLVPYLLVAGTLAVAGLFLNNAMTDFTALSTITTPLAYWIQVGGLLVYLVWLFYCYRRRTE